MKILYIITQKEGQTDAVEKTTASLNFQEGHLIHVFYSDEISEEAAINKAIENITEDYSHFCILPAGSELRSNYISVIADYLKDEPAIYLPLVEYCYDESGEESFKGLLNTICWKAHIAREVGVLSLDLSVKQADTTLYGALIASNILRDNKLNEEIKYFSQFEYLNRVNKANISVLGVPKVLFALNKDFELKSVSKDEKIIYFEKAREGYTPKIE